MKLISILSCLAMMGLTSCISGGAVGDESEPKASPTISVTVRHVHYPAANDIPVIKNDVPKPVRIELNGIPGKFEGTPTSDNLVDTVLIDDSPFRITWERLMQVPTTQPLPFIGSMLVDSVTPAATKIMRMGTFAGDASDESVFPDSLFESYGLFDTSLNVGVTAVYFSGAATIHADRLLCDSTRVKFQLRIPGAGFWLFYTSQSGKEMRLSLLGDTRNLVFGVSTFSQAGLDYIMAKLEGWQGCLGPAEKAGDALKRASVWRLRNPGF